MVSIFEYIKSKLHIHLHSVPVVARYVSFNWREVIYECRCGRRVVRRVPFCLVSIELAIMITEKEFQQYLTNGKYYKDRYACGELN